MIFSPFRRNRRPDTISALYGTIVAQARLPCFYRDYGVADTVNGRFDLLVLHLVLVLERLVGEAALTERSQALFDRFCRDMDDNLREIGIADLKVPKEMRRIGEAFYGRAQAYRTALAAEGDDALAAAVARNVYSGAPPDPAAPRRLAAYMRVALRELRAQQADAIAAGDLRWPDPVASLSNAHEDPQARV
ncbi:MAG: ubiquinol-cytochrome C chaperone family protein [Pseudolabrys sp.]